MRDGIRRDGASLPNIPLDSAAEAAPRRPMIGVGPDISEFNEVLQQGQGFITDLGRLGEVLDRISVDKTPEFSGQMGVLVGNRRGSIHQVEGLAYIFDEVPVDERPQLLGQVLTLTENREGSILDMEGLLGTLDEVPVEQRPELVNLVSRLAENREGSIRDIDNLAYSLDQFGQADDLLGPEFLDQVQTIVDNRVGLVTDVRGLVHALAGIPSVFRIQALGQIGPGMTISQATDRLNRFEPEAPQAVNAVRAHRTALGRRCPGF